MIVNEIIAKLMALPPECRTQEAFFPVQTSPGKYELLPIDKIEQSQRVCPIITEVKPIIVIS